MRNNEMLASCPAPRFSTTGAADSRTTTTAPAPWVCNRGTIGQSRRADRRSRPTDIALQSAAPTRNGSAAKGAQT
jgi:hypothetical protein